MTSQRLLPPTYILSPSLATFYRIQNLDGWIPILHAWIFWEMTSTVCWKIHCGVWCEHSCNANNIWCMCLAFTLKFIHKHLPAGWYILWNGINTRPLQKKSALVCGNHITDSLWVYSMIGYSGKWHQDSVGKFTVVYNVHIYYSMATILFACVLW